VCSFPTCSAIIRLVGAVLAEQDAERMITLRYTSFSLLRKTEVKTNQTQGEETERIEGGTDAGRAAGCLISKRMVQYRYTT